MNNSSKTVRFKTVPFKTIPTQKFLQSITTTSETPNEKFKEYYSERQFVYLKTLKIIDYYLKLLSKHHTIKESFEHIIEIYTSEKEHYSLDGEVEQKNLLSIMLNELQYYENNANGHYSKLKNTWKSCSPTIRYAWTNIFRTHP